MPEQQFRRRPDGTVYPLTPAKPKWPGPVLGAIVLTVALTAGGTVSVAGGSGLAGASRATSVKGSAQTRSRDARAVVRRLIRAGNRVDVQASSDADDCAAHSYGQVQEFFAEHPCAGLYRVLLEVPDRRGGLVLVAVAWVDMPDESSARALQRLVDRHGTGNVTELNRERGGRHGDVRFTGERYASVRQGSIVVNAQAEPVEPGALAAGVAERVVAEWERSPG
jgi:hypothetical protein